jgi:hypothetical protein
MKGAEIAWRTLSLEQIHEPCLVGAWIMKGEFFSRLTGRDFWAAREDVAIEAFQRLGINLCPQLALPAAPGEGRTGTHADVKKRLEDTLVAWKSPEQVKEAIEKLPDPQALHRNFNLEKAAQAYANNIKKYRDRSGDDILWLSGFGQADFMGGYNRWGYKNYLEAIALYPEHMKRYYDYTGEQGYLYNLGVVEAVRRFGLAPFVYGGQDICFNDGPICSPEVLRKIYFPALRRAVQPLIENGIGIIWHCDGNILPILDDLLDLGIAGFQGFQEESGVKLEKMASLRTKAGKKPILWGSVSVTTTLPFGSREDVKRDVERCFRVAGPGGGFGLASTSSILPETPDENILALYHYGMEFGRSFLR